MPIMQIFPGAQGSNIVITYEEREASEHAALGRLVGGCCSTRLAMCGAVPDNEEFLTHLRDSCILSINLLTSR